ncbi:hypothetical protein [Bacillus norwichensis]|uniref:Uncharacterized protein n=1 Tax=Bacillus norwichensis TaxID=2762217 RepID=A0ABR8VGM0_9BACI|nr:hypothetical protein [Bacillus norwichensis]MBD8003875.1 hypothetical protein [Bacillus norwichensis]
MDDFTILVLLLFIGTLLTFIVNKVKKNHSNKLGAIIWIMIGIIFLYLWYFK